MARSYAAIEILKSVDEVFEYVTTPGNWPQWHPSSLGVTGATDHSLEVGEQCVEEYLVASRQGKTTWTVREREAPRLWVIEADINDGIVSYILTPQGEHTFFERVFTYTVASPSLDRELLWRRVDDESRRALEQLKQVLEQ